jgi:hypothetical protein
MTGVIPIPFELFERRSSAPPPDGGFSSFDGLRMRVIRELILNLMLSSAGQVIMAAEDRAACALAPSSRKASFGAYPGTKHPCRRRDGCRIAANAADRMTGVMAG